jgi:hypothetical protein
MKWQNKITKKQLKHIKETTDTGTLAQFIFNREWHRERMAEGEREPCFECREIALRLGIEA